MRSPREYSAHMETSALPLKFIMLSNYRLYARMDIYHTTPAVTYDHSDLTVFYDTPGVLHLH